MRSAWDRALVAKVGSSVFAFALAIPTSLPAAGGHTVTVGIAGASPDALVVEVAPVASEALGALELPEARKPPRPSVAPVRVAAFSVLAAPRTVPPPEPLTLDGVVVASWYGPGFYGNRTACGLTYTPEMLGVAHRTLPCGTRIQLTSPAGVTIVVPVIDRGPYVGGRSLDLSNAAKLALQCGDLCRVRMAVLQ